MPNTSLREATPTTLLLLYQRLRQRRRYFSTRGSANDAAQYKSVQVPHAQCPLLIFLHTSHNFCH
ncbi:MAG: hypothetical protein ACYTXA_00205 [Nostoc sp.]